MFRLLLCPLLLIVAPHAAALDDLSAPPEGPVRIIFDTDMGNDVDDALAQGVIHALQSRGECELLAVTSTKDHPLSVAFIDVINHFYGRGDIPVGAVRDGVTRSEGRFNGLAQVRDNGELRYPHRVHSGEDAPEAAELLREVLAAQPDASVAIAQVGFSSNLARLLETAPDDHSPLNGRELVAQKVRVLSIMAGAFDLIDGNVHREYNVVQDLPAARKLAAEWPTPIIWSGYEIGYAIRYPAASIENDFGYVAHHPLPEAYQLYNPTPHERPTWDLTSVLWAVRPHREYFDLSPRGTVHIDEAGVTTFEENEAGMHRYLIATEEQRIRVREALAMLTSQPPDKQ